MENATNQAAAAKPGRVALILDERATGRISPGLVSYVGPNRDYGIIDIGQPVHRILERLQRWQPAGIIMQFREDLAEVVLSLGHPSIIVMADLLMDGVGCVNVDDEAVGRRAAAYLWEKGLRQFAFCGFDRPHAPARRMGFEKLLEKKGYPWLTIEIPETLTAGRLGHSQKAQLARWLESLPNPVGVFVAHDPLGVELMEICRESGIQVPEQVAILAASNDQLACEMHYPGISSVEIPWKWLGKETGRLMERMIAGYRPGEPLLVEPRCIHSRRSTEFYHVRNQRVQEAIALMQETLSEEVDVGILANRLGMHRRVLERLFRKYLNKTPKTVFTEIRTERARELLEQNELPIGEVASLCGFGASEKLSRAFRQRHGMTPREWRRRHPLSG